MSQRLITALEDVKTLPHITLGSIVNHIEGEALLILSLVSIIPFMQPIPIPGVSSLLGFIVFLQGLGLIFWGKPVLTERLKRVNISHERFEKIYRAALKFNKFTTKISTFKHPMTNTRVSHILCGVSIVITSAFLSLPLPIPFSNLIPALSIFFICVGLLEEDLVLILCGHGIALTVLWMIVFSFQMIVDLWQQWF